MGAFSYHTPQLQSLGVSYTCSSLYPSFECIHLTLICRILLYHKHITHTAFKFRFLALEVIIVLLLFFAIPVGAHGEIVGIAICNLMAIAWFWYNSVRSVEVTVDGGLRFWIGNYEMDIPFDKIVEMRRETGECSTMNPAFLFYRGYMTNPTDGVVIITSVASTPPFMWPRSAGKPERKLGPFSCPRLKILFSPAGGSLNFLREVDQEMKSSREELGGNAHRIGGIQPPSFDTNGTRRGNMRVDGTGDFFDV